MPAQITAEARTHRFVALDILRLLAAVAVVIFHISEEQVLQHAYLAVDFFFLLSGFVMAYTYQERLDAGWPTRSFLKVRLVRLYPLYLIGTCFGLALVLILHKLHAPGYSVRNILRAVACAFVLLPAPQTWSRYLFPLNIPSWSLFAEVFGNVYHAVLLRRRSLPFLTCIVGGAALLLSLVSYRFGTLSEGADGFDPDLRVRYAAAMMGPLRCAFSYALGVLTFLKRQEAARPWTSIPLWLGAALFCGFLEIPHARFNGAVDWVLVTLALPSLFVLLVNAPVTGWAKKPFVLALVDGTYALYIIHLPLIGFAARGYARMMHSPRMSISFQIVLVTSIILLATGIARFVDRPIRKWLSAVLSSRAKAL